MEPPFPDTSRTGNSRLALIELLERDGRVSRVMDVHAWPLSVGRALSCDLVIDDPHVAALHATLQVTEAGTLRLQVGDTVNGLQCAGRTLRAGEATDLPASGGTLQLGALRLRVRLPREALAAEKPLPSSALASGRTAGVAAVLLALLSTAEHWTALDPGADFSAWMPLLLGLPAAIFGWAGLWALASKLFQHRFDFTGHLRIMLPWLLGMTLIDALMQPLAAALGWPWLWRVSPLLQALLVLLMLRAQLLHVLPHSRRAVTVAAVAAAVSGLALSLTLTHRQTDRVSRPPYMSSLPMPALQLDTPVPSAQLVQDMAPLAARLTRRVEKAQADEAADGDSGTAAD